ncbi:MAG: glutaredoxin family protein [Gaiella sp.]
MPKVTMYTTSWCGLCARARSLLASRGISYTEVSLDEDRAFRQKVFDLGGRWTVPLVVADGAVIGGYQELAALDRSGALAERLAA